LYQRNKFFFLSYSKRIKEEEEEADAGANNSIDSLPISSGG
jgi:hypothetical protein